MLQRPGVFVRSSTRVLKLIEGIISDGPKHLQVITDFDRTLTKFSIVSRKTGEIRRGWSSYELFRESYMLPEVYNQEALQLRSVYHPIEIDPVKTDSEKLPFMIQWFEKAFHLYAKHGLRKDSIKAGVQHSDLQLRGLCKEVLETLAKLEVPVLILSAGVSQAIEEILRQHAVFPSNIRLIANELCFDENGVCTGRAPNSQLIHMYNKAHAVEDHLGRRNAIVMGDMIADLDAVVGKEEKFKNLLKIGFLNLHEDEQMQVFLDHFDIVLTGDPTMELVYDIVKSLSTSNT